MRDYRYGEPLQAGDDATWFDFPCDYLDTDGKVVEVDGELCLLMPKYGAVKIGNSAHVTRWVEEANGTVDDAMGET